MTRRKHRIRIKERQEKKKGKRILSRGTQSTICIGRIARIIIITDIMEYGVEKCISSSYT